MSNNYLTVELLQTVKDTQSGIQMQSSEISIIKQSLAKFEANQFLTYNTI